MLVIVKNLRKVLSKPKYHRILDHVQWSVYDMDKKETVFGPESHKACMQYMSKTEDTKL